MSVTDSAAGGQKDALIDRNSEGMAKEITSTVYALGEMALT